MAQSLPTRPDKPASHYWRITIYQHEHEYVKADILEVSKGNCLVFKRMVFHDFANNKKEYIISHSVTRDRWTGVTECNKEGVPLWQFNYAGPVLGEEDPEEELPPHPDASDEELEVLSMYVEHVMKQVAESAVESATRKSAE